ncbi:MAG: nuclear transport factor 2 family protein [Bacteroidia bacterium]|nr:nuclear transport factor 2 family protein [Bacteroidia bacterium]
MKRMIISLSFIAFVFFAFGSVLSENDSEKIHAAVKEFVKSADKQDVNSMDKIMHKEFRTVANQLFGAPEVSVINKSSYLAMMKEGKLGGDSRKVKIEEIEVIGKNAVVKATFTGKKLIFQTFVQLVKGPDGEWKVISDMPVIQKV